MYRSTFSWGSSPRDTVQIVRLMFHGKVNRAVQVVNEVPVRSGQYRHRVELPRCIEAGMQSRHCLSENVVVIQRDDADFELIL